MIQKAFFNQSLLTAASRIRSAKKILITGHIHPDGDTIGSLLALGLGLLDIGKRVVMVSPDGMPPRFQFLPGSELVLDDFVGRADLAIAVDCGSEKQLGQIKGAFHKARKTIQIDHHDFGDAFGEELVVDADAAAVGEIIYDLLVLLKAKITPAIATCLLTSIIVDTGSFRFSNIRSRTFAICADLLDKGVDLRYLIEESYWKKSVATARLEAAAISKMRFEMNGRLVWTLVRRNDFKKAAALPADVDGVADDLRSIEGVKIACVIREMPQGTYRVSLRSEAGYNVAKVAKRFGGGGHHNAAGCILKGANSNRDRLLKSLFEILA